MRMRLIILVVLIALGAVVAAVFLLQSDSGGDADNGNAGSVSVEPGPGGQAFGELPIVDIVVAVQNIPRGTVIEENMVRVTSWPAESIPEDDDWNYFFANQLFEVYGKIARTDIARGAPILSLQVVDAIADVAFGGSDAAAIMTTLPPETVAVAIPLDPTGIGQVAYGIQDGDRVDVILSFLFVDVDPTFQTRLPNNLSIISSVETGELTIGSPRQGRLEPSTLTPLGNLVGPSETSQRPRLVTQRTVTNAFVVHVGYFPEGGQFIGATPTPIEADEAPPPPGDETGEEQQQSTPEPSPSPFTPLIITLAVPPQQALVLTWAVDSQIPITLALRQAGDETFSETLPVTLDYMIRTYNAAPPNALEFALEPPITSVRRFDIGTLFNFLASSFVEP